MAFLLNNSISSRLRSHSQMLAPSRGFHVEPGTREQALLADHPALNRYPSLKKTVRTSKKIGNVLTAVVVAGCCYEIYVRATMRDEARKQARQNA